MKGERSKFRTKRVLALIALCFVAFALSGCGASLTVYDYTEDGVRYNEYELTIDNDIVQKMERTATLDRDGNKYTVKSYFYALFTGFGYELAGAQKTETVYIVRYRKVVTDLSDLEKLGSPVKFVTTHTENPFVRTYRATSQNPFNGVREAFDNIAPLTSTTILEQIKNGIIARNEYNELVVVFPSIYDAFPYLKGLDASGLLLNYVRTGARRMESSGRTVAIDDKTSNYVFSRYFDDTRTTVDFEYKRPVSYGWYMVAIAAGAVTLAIFVLATRTKKQKPTLLDRFPYNPETYRDYDSNLPSKL
ncbi:MAG: hypothetical protein J1G01_02985 [Clostridiales bacterium]|nr:hypothetical protein [Clostridiales bacterium]